MLTFSSIGKAGAGTRFIIIRYCESIYIIITPRDFVGNNSGHCGPVRFIFLNLTVSPFSQLLDGFHRFIIPMTIKAIIVAKRASQDKRLN